MVKLYNDVMISYLNECTSKNKNSNQLPARHRTKTETQRQRLMFSLPLLNDSTMNQVQVMKEVMSSRVEA